MENFSTKAEANLSSQMVILVAFSIAISFIVFCLKYYAFLQTGSIALYSDAMESIVNIIISIIAFVAIKIALLPADKNHPYGHNKVEYFSAAIEGLIIIMAALFILTKVWENFQLHKTEFLLNHKAYLPSVMAAFLQGGWGYFTLKKAQKHNCITIHADALHFITDFASTIAILSAVTLAYYTKYYYIDQVIAIIVSIYISWQGFKIIKKAIEGLMDHSVDKATYKIIREIIAKNGVGALEAHDLKTRIAGYITFIEFHLVVESDMKVKEAHDICNQIEDALKKKFINSRIIIHIEPEEEAKINRNIKQIPII